MVLQTLGIVNALPNMSIPIRVSNYAKKWTKFKKRVLREVGPDLLGVIVHLDQAAIIHPEKKDRKEDMALAEAVAVIHYIEKEYRGAQMERNKRFGTVHDDRLENDLQENVDIGKQYAGNRQKILDTFA